jgi:GntR family transcriptional regulator/MocR family aminotransferase
VIIVNGSQQAIALTAATLVDPGDRVVLEAPHYPALRRVLQAAAADVVTVPVDEEGIELDRLHRRGAGARLVCVTPSHQFPTGVILSFPRRMGLLAWAERQNAYILEDDYASEYRYTGRPIESLQGLDRTGRVIYTGTFSKVLFPALRLGYVVPPASLLGVFLTAKALTDTGSPITEQLALADFIREGDLERHIRRTRSRNAARRATLLAAIDKHLGDRVEVSGDSAGLHVLLWLRNVKACDLPAVIDAAAAKGVGIYPATPCQWPRADRAGLILGYAPLTENELRAGIERLGSVIP